MTFQPHSNHNFHNFQSQNHLKPSSSVELQSLISDAEANKLKQASLRIITSFINKVQHQILLQFNSIIERQIFP